MNDTKKKKVLIFEDDTFLADIIVTKLQLNGFEAVAYPDGTDPVNRTLKENPDLIMMSVIMPKKDGYQATKLLKSDERTKNILLVFWTTLGQKENIEKGLSMGAVDYLIKGNFTPNELAIRICKILGRPIPENLLHIQRKAIADTNSVKVSLTQKKWGLMKNKFVIGLLLCLTSLIIGQIFSQPINILFFSDVFDLLSLVVLAAGIYFLFKGMLITRGGVRFWKSISILFGILLLAGIGLTIYVNYSLPHGPSYSTGDVICENEERGPCHEVYKEDLRAVDIPEWAKFIRTDSRWYLLGFLMLFAEIIAITKLQERTEKDD